MRATALIGLLILPAIVAAAPQAMPPVPLPPLPKPTISVEAAQARGVVVRAMLAAVRDGDAKAFARTLAPGALFSSELTGAGAPPTIAMMRDTMAGCVKKGPLEVDDNRVVVEFACTPPRPDGDLALLVYFTGTAITRIVPTGP